MMMLKFLPVLLLLSAAAAQSDTSTTAASSGQIFDVEPFNVASTGALSGELKRWHRITLGFSGRPTSETNDIMNPFTDFRLDVTFTHATASNISYVCPGFYAADGNAANSGAFSGSAWLVHFTPSEVGEWRWQASFVQGENVVLTNNGTSASFFDGSSGTFVVEESDKDKTGRDFRGKGLLRYVGGHHLQFSNGEYFMKVGMASPENILAYEDFDGALNNTNGYLKTWAPHEQDYQPGNQTWMGGRGTALIGALNYLASKEQNSFRIQTLTLDGDDGTVSPFLSTPEGEVDTLRYDVSRLAQWEVVLDHAENLGLHVHVRLSEQENDQLLGGLGLERMVYYRELIARFSHHLALTWNRTFLSRLGKWICRLTRSTLASLLLLLRILFFQSEKKTRTRILSESSLPTTLSHWTHIDTPLSCTPQRHTKDKHIRRS